MDFVDRKDFCIIPWTAYTLRHNNVSTCCWNTKGFIHPFGHYEGPWKGDFCRNNPEVVSQRKQMLEFGTSKCPDLCPFKNCLPTIKKQIENCAIDEKTSTASNKLLEMITSGSTDSVSPFSLTISASLQCNQRCPICMLDFGSFKDLRKEPTLEEIGNLLPLYENVNYFATCGGDTFGMSDERIDLFYSPLVGRKMSIRVQTNGRGLTLPRYERFCENGPINHVTLSLSSTNPDHYRIIHGSDVETILKNLEDITSKYPKHKIVYLSFVLTSINISELPEYIVFAGDHGIKTIFTFVLNPANLQKRGVAYLDPFREGFNAKLYADFKETEAKIESMKKDRQFVLRGWENFCSLFNSRGATI